MKFSVIIIAKVNRFRVFRASDVSFDNFFAIGRVDHNSENLGGVNAIQIVEFQYRPAKKLVVFF